jgi:hypothetical protein
MSHVVLSDNEKYYQVVFMRENEFENKIRRNSTLIFGEKSIFLDVKNLINTSSLGGAIPDGFLFDFRDEENPDFYIVEVELEKHARAITLGSQIFLSPRRCFARVYFSLFYIII